MLGIGNFITKDVTKSGFPPIYVPLYLHYHLSTQNNSCSQVLHKPHKEKQVILLEDNYFCYK